MLHRQYRVVELPYCKCKKSRNRSSKFRKSRFACPRLSTKWNHSLVVRRIAAAAVNIRFDNQRYRRADFAQSSKQRHRYTYIDIAKHRCRLVEFHPRKCCKLLLSYPLNLATKLFRSACHRKPRVSGRDPVAASESELARDQVAELVLGQVVAAEWESVSEWGRDRVAVVVAELVLASDRDQVAVAEWELAPEWGMCRSD